MKTGRPPTARKARTGLLTPPGITFSARSKSDVDTGSLTVPPSLEIGRRRCRGGRDERGEVGVASQSGQGGIFGELVGVRDLAVDGFPQLTERKPRVPFVERD